MVDLILQYGVRAFEAFFLVVFFFLIFYRGRYRKNHPIPRYIYPIVSSYHYHIGVAWIMLFFSSIFLFAKSDPGAHTLGFLWLLMSFGAIVLARNAFEIDRYKGCRRR